MLMVVDVGNTSTEFGVYNGKDLVGDWRMATGVHRTADEYAILIRAFLGLEGIKLQSLTAAIVSCVVPPVLPFIGEMFVRRLNVKPLFVEPGIKTGISILIENPKEVGADRIVNAVAAYERFKQDCIIIDFGTATTFDVVSGRGEYLGGLIFPGITISAEALFTRTAKLPQIEVIRPETVIGRNTIQSIQSGIYYGYSDMVDGLIRRIKATMTGPVRVLATGGYASLIGEETTGIDEIIPMLTLEGLRIIYEKNSAFAASE